MSATSKKSKSKSNKFRAGDVYSIKEKSSIFAAVKALVVEHDTIHVCLYSQRFTTRPKSIASESLAVLPPGKGEGLGILHLPLAISDFVAWEPKLVLRATVTDDELGGYKIWKSSGGGVFD